MYFAVHVEPASYALTIVLVLIFAALVSAITNRSLDRIDMVEALKSMEQKPVDSLDATKARALRLVLSQPAG